MRHSQHKGVKGNRFISHFPIPWGLLQHTEKITRSLKKREIVTVLPFKGNPKGSHSCSEITFFQRTFPPLQSWTCSIQLLEKQRLMDGTGDRITTDLAHCFWSDLKNYRKHPNQSPQTKDIWSIVGQTYREFCWSRKTNRILSHSALF